MKASESSERYEGKVRECCNYAARSAKNFSENVKTIKRQPCGADETRLADTLKEDLNGFCDTVTEEKFPVSQKAYILSNLLVFIFMLLASATAILSFFFEEIIMAASILFSILSLLAFFGAFGGTSKKLESKNIFATRNCSEDVKNRIIIEANLDAPFKRKISVKTERGLKIFNFFLILVNIAFGIVSLLISFTDLDFAFCDKFIYIAFITPLFAIVPIVLSRSVIITESTPGVSDNLVGCYTACGALRYMSEMDLRLKNTELCVLLTGARNAKQAGAKAYTESHAEADKAVDTTVISLNTIYNAENLCFLTKDKKLDKFMNDAAKNADVMITDAEPKYIKTEAKVFKKAKISNVTMTTLPDEIPTFYDSVADTNDYIHVPAIEATMKTVLEAAYLKDSVQ